MANRRMFSVDVVCTDKFLEMPASSQALYLQLGMKADDDGFVSAPKQITRMTNASEDDFRILVSKGYIIPFDSGVIVIKDWRVNNYLRKDRYTETRHLTEKSVLEVVNDVYVISDELRSISVSGVPSGIPEGIPVVSQGDTQVRIGKDSIVKSNNYSVHFEEFWKVYPRKKEKAKAHKCYLARLKDGFSEEELLAAAQRYAEECREKHTEERYIKHGATFLSANTPFVDYLPKQEEQKKNTPASAYYEKYLQGGMD